MKKHRFGGRKTFALSANGGVLYKKRRNVPAKTVILRKPKRPESKSVEKFTHTEQAIIQTNGMIIIFVRAIILFAVLLFVIRLMGKRQIGEMEPFELVITLVIAELACIPMADRSIPITFGIVAILTMFVIHQAILLISKSMKMQTIISGKPVMVIDKNGIDMNSLKKLNMQVYDLLQAMRTSDHFSLEEIRYGIMETNGQLTVIAEKSMEDRQQTLPVPVLMEGKWNDDDMQRNGITRESVMKILAKEHVKPQNVVLLTLDENNRMALQTKNRAVYYKNVGEVERV